VTDVRVLVVDDHPLFRKGLAATIEALPDMVLAGVASDGADAVEAVRHDPPDVVLLDLAMPGMGGIDAAVEIGRVAPQVAVLVLTMSEDPESLFAAVRAGARGYLLKGADEAEIRRAVLAVADGDAVFGAGVASYVLGHFGSRPVGGIRPPVFPELTEREREILVLMAQGLGNAGIAHRLVLSQKTVRNHVSNVLGKLHAESRDEAVRRAHEAGL
jgi:DNA-binding NarL/FixJ family response regulator